MKNHFLAFSLFAISALAAKEQNCECCIPCCCTQLHEKCIDCEAYTPAFYDLKCDCGFFVTGEFLYWYATETNLPIAAVLETILAFPPTASEPVPRRATVIKDFEYGEDEWDPGFRVGLGWNSSCDGWDFYANYTYYHNSATRSVSVPPIESPVPNAGGRSLFNPWVNLTLSDPFFDRISAKWEFTLNSIDAEIGRKYWLSACFNLRPYAGIRASWIETNFKVKGSLGPTNSIENVNITNVQNATLDSFMFNFWGVGILSGLQPTWYFVRCFALYGNMDLSLIWGNFDGKKDEKYVSSFDNSGVFTQQSDVKNTVNDGYSRMQAILDLGIGLRWERTWCCNRYRTSFDAGWEHHIWFDSYRYTYSQGVTVTVTQSGAPLSFFQSIGSLNNDLGFGGLVVRAHFDF